MLTEQQIAEYLDQGGVICPYCESLNIEGDSVEVDAGGSTQVVTCADCGASWYDCYTLTGIIEMEVLNCMTSCGTGGSGPSL